MYIYVLGDTTQSCRYARKLGAALTFGHSQANDAEQSWGSPDIRPRSGNLNYAVWVSECQG